MWVICPRQIRWSSVEQAAICAYWIGFSLFLMLLQFIVNRPLNVFAVVLSILGAIPVALLLAFRSRSTSRQ